MKKLILITTVLTLSMGMMAQDDVYFVPTKANKAKEAQSYGMPKDTYYSGSDRSVDDYNRRPGNADTNANDGDVIDFSATKGVYPDNDYTDSSAEDYQYTRQMTRFDDYTPSQAYWDGFRDGSWSSPWYYNSWYSWYDYSWYWNDPWYYRSYYGYYRPWGYYSWYVPRYYSVGGGRHYGQTRVTPSRHVVRNNRTVSGRNSSSVSNGGLGNNRRPVGGVTHTNNGSSNSSGNVRSSGSFGGSRSSGSFGGGSSRGSGSFGGGGSRGSGSFHSTRSGR